MASDNDFINVFEAAALLGVHDQTLRKLARQKKLPAFKVGKEWRFRRGALITWADEQGQETDDGDVSCSVIVIDDDEKVCRALARTVARIGCAARQATSGALGLELIGEEVPDLVLLDLMMPDMNGPMFLEELRKVHPTLPVVIVTGHPNGELMQQATAYAPVMLLSKPVDSALLQRTIESVLGKQKHAHAAASQSRATTRRTQ